MADSAKPKKKPNRSSEFRREQNRLAQKRYRARKKEAWAKLNASVSQSHVESPVVQATAQDNAFNRQPSPPLPTPLASADAQETLDAAAEAMRIKPLFARIQKAMASAATLQAESTGLISPGLTPSHNENTTTDENQNEIRALANAIIDASADFTAEYIASVSSNSDMTAVDTFDASLIDPDFADATPSTSLAQMPTSDRAMVSYTCQPAQSSLMAQTINPQYLAQCFPYHSSPRANHIKLEYLNLHSAAMRNAYYLGIAHDDMKEELASPFFHEPNTLALPGAAAARRRVFDFLSPDLRPVETQLTVPHPAWLDTIPLPAFRDGVLLHWPVLQTEWNGRAAALLGQLSQDLREGGMVCWEGVSGQGRSGIPWDGRSWQMKGWFVRKWKWMFGRGSEDMIRSMRWWATMRGEDF